MVQNIEFNLDKLIHNMTVIGDMLVPFNFPRGPILEDSDLDILKQREATIDGYPVWMLYQKFDYETHYMKTLQIYGKNSPFLPFTLICKLGKRFLGEDYLSLVEVFKDGRKIYVWNVFADKENVPIPPPYELESEDCNFEGFSYAYMQPTQVNFF